MTALDVNYPLADITITNHGSSFDWAIFAIMLFVSLAIFMHSHRRPVEARIFHLLAASALFISAVAYFTMASNLGYEPIVVQMVRHFDVTDGSAVGVTRAIWYTRYVAWSLIFPLIILTLLLVTGLPLSSIFLTIFWVLVMIITRLIGALVMTSYKWGYFAFSVFATAYVIYMLLGPARNSSIILGPAFNSLYTKTAAFLSFLLILYPVAWGLSEGGNVIHPDSEMVFYAVLDFLSHPVLLSFFLLMLAKTPFPSLSFNSNLAGHSVSTVEKGVVAAPAAAPAAVHPVGASNLAPASHLQPAYAAPATTAPVAAHTTTAAPATVAAPTVV